MRCEVAALLPLEACRQSTSASQLAQPGLKAGRSPASTGCMLPCNARPDPWWTWAAALLIQWPSPDLQSACSSSSSYEAGQVSPRAARRVLARRLTDSGQSPRATQTGAYHSAGGKGPRGGADVSYPRVPRERQRRAERRGGSNKPLSIDPHFDAVLPKHRIEALTNLLG